MPRKIIDLPEKILKATIAIGAKKGVNNISTIEISKKCKISEMPIFKYFQTKQNLLTQAFLSVDKMIDKEFINFKIDTINIEKSIEEFWLIYFKFLISHENETKYYQSFRNSTFFNYDISVLQTQIFTNYTMVIRELSNVMDMSDLGSYEANVFWDFIISNSLAFAVRIIDKKFPNDEKSISAIFRLIFHALLIGRIKA